MTNLTLKIIALLALTLSSMQLMAKSPWADEDPVAAEPVAIDFSTDTPPAEPESVQNGPVIIQQTINPTDEPEQNTQTQTPPRDVYTQQTQQGDVLNVDNSTETVAVKILDFPVRGMSTDKVKNELGQPAEIISGVGQPPISRWIYDDRTVYFEYSTVLHVVAR